MHWAERVKMILLKIRYSIPKTETYGKYTVCPPYPYWTYSPWLEEWFQEIYNKIKYRTMVTPDRCYIIHQFCLHCLNLEGDFAECGVYKGGTAYLIADTLVNSNIEGKQVHLLDTFAGMPETANDDPSGLMRGSLGDTSLEAVQGFLNPLSNVVFHPGYIPETLEPLQDKKFAFVHVDVDLYQSAKDCCEFFYERMPRGGVMIFDDYGFMPFRYSAKQAVDEYFESKPEIPISLRTGQGIVIKL